MLPRTASDFAAMLVVGDHNTGIVHWMARFQQELHDVLCACLTLYAKQEAAIGFFYVHLHFEMARRELALDWTHNPLCNGNPDQANCVLERNFPMWYARFGLLDMPEQIFKDFLNEVTIELTHATYDEKSVSRDGDYPELHFTLRPSGERVVLKRDHPYTIRIHDKSNSELCCGVTDIVIKAPALLGQDLCPSDNVDPCSIKDNILIVAVKRLSACGRLSVALVGLSKTAGAQGKWIVYVEFRWPGPRQRFYDFGRWHNLAVREFDKLQWKANQIRNITC